MSVNLKSQLQLMRDDINKVRINGYKWAVASQLVDTITLRVNSISSTSMQVSLISPVNTHVGTIVGTPIVTYSTNTFYLDVQIDDVDFGYKYIARVRGTTNQYTSYFNEGPWVLPSGIKLYDLIYLDVYDRYNTSTSNYTVYFYMSVDGETFYSKDIVESVTFTPSNEIEFRFKYLYGLTGYEYDPVNFYCDKYTLVPSYYNDNIIRLQYYNASDELEPNIQSLRDYTIGIVVIDSYPIGGVPQLPYVGAPYPYMPMLPSIEDVDIDVYDQLKTINNEIHDTLLHCYNAALGSCLRVRYICTFPDPSLLTSDAYTNLDIVPMQEYPTHGISFIDTNMPRVQIDTRSPMALKVQFGLNRPSDNYIVNISSPYFETYNDNLYYRNDMYSGGNTTAYPPIVQFMNIKYPSNKLSNYVQYIIPYTPDFFKKGMPLYIDIFKFYTSPISYASLYWKSSSDYIINGDISSIRVNIDSVKLYFHALYFGFTNDINSPATVLYYNTSVISRVNVEYYSDYTIVRLYDLDDVIMDPNTAGAEFMVYFTHNNISGSKRISSFSIVPPFNTPQYIVSNTDYVWNPLTTNVDVETYLTDIQKYIGFVSNTAYSNALSTRTTNTYVYIVPKNGIDQLQAISTDVDTPSIALSEYSDAYTFEVMDKVRQFSLRISKAKSIVYDDWYTNEDFARVTSVENNVFYIEGGSISITTPGTIYYLDAIMPMPMKYGVLSRTATANPQNTGTGLCANWSVDSIGTYTIDLMDNGKYMLNSTISIKEVTGPSSPNATIEYTPDGRYIIIRFWNSTGTSQTKPDFLLTLEQKSNTSWITNSVAVMTTDSTIV